MLNSVVVPIVVEKDPNGFERSYDIYSRLLKDFIVFVTGPIDLAVANTFIAQILFLESVDEKRDISVYINSPGGEAYAGRAMYDTMKYVKNDISTINGMRVLTPHVSGASLESKATVDEATIILKDKRLAPIYKGRTLMIFDYK